MNTNKYFNKFLNKKFMFEFDDKQPDDLLKGGILITILIIIYIKIFNR